ncbi:MAG: hypothetical protein ACPGD8_05140, partial [Flavobacteriales bacterium]
MANKLTTEEQIKALQDEKKELQSQLKSKDEVIEGQNAELEKAGAEKKHKAVIVTGKKPKASYKAKAAGCTLRVDGELKSISIYDKESGKQLVDDAGIAVILGVEGQNILE